MKHGIILAAGLGTRLCEGNVRVSSKPLVLVSNLPLLLRTINSHEKAGCEKVIIVLGWEAEEIRNYVMKEYKGPLEVQFVFNRDYKLQNGVSVLCAKDFVGQEFILTMADHILDDRIMRMLPNQKAPSDGAILCVDYKIETIFDLDDATKVLTNDKTIKRIGKNIENFNCVDTGVFIGTCGLLRAIEQVYQQKGDASLSEGVQILSDLGRMAALDIGNAYWQDVDTPEMLQHAEKLLSPKKIK